MRAAVAASAAALLLLPGTARSDPACVPVPVWDERCEAWTALWSSPDNGAHGDDDAAGLAVAGEVAYAVANAYDGTHGTHDVVVLARRTSDGAPLWQRLLATPGQDAAGGVAVHDGVVYVSAALGRRVWRGDGGWSSIDADSGTVTTVALDARTGRTLWSVPAPRPGTPRAVAADATGAYVAVDHGARAALVAYDTRGRARWTRLLSGEAVPAHVVTDRGGVLWSARRYGDASGATAERLTARGRVAWSRTRPAAVPGALAADGAGGAYVATNAFAPATLGAGGAGVAHQARRSHVVALDARGRPRWSREAEAAVTDALVLRGRLWLGEEGGAPYPAATAEELDARTGETARTVTVADPRASLTGARLVPHGRGVAVVARASDLGTAYCLTYAVGPEGDAPAWVARWDTAENDSCRPAGAGADSAGRVVVAATAAYVPAQQREPARSANFADVALLAYGPA